MFELLAKRHVDDYQNYQDKDVRLRLISLSGIVGIVINFLLFGIKLTVGIISKSNAVLNDAFNNISDAITSLISMVGAKASTKPADEDHPLGHGRSEYVASFIVSIIIILVGWELLINSVKSFFAKTGPNISIVGLIIMALSILFKVYIYVLNRGLAKKLDSNLNYAVQLDAKNDILSTSSIILSLILGKYVSFNLDAIMAVIISIIVIKPGIDLAKETINQLIGQRVDVEIEEEIKNIILAGDFITGYHDLKLYEYGQGRIFGSVHVEVPENIMVGTMHESVSQVEELVKEKTGVDLTVHTDPTTTLVNNEHNRQIKEKLESSSEYGNKDLQNK